jgi:mRNA-degrading endonuclease HigB of HigAB toxin-antitoxin module
VVAEFWAKHSDAESPLLAWYRAVESEVFAAISDILNGTRSINKEIAMRFAQLHRRGRRITPLRACPRVPVRASV